MITSLAVAAVLAVALPVSPDTQYDSRIPTLEEVVGHATGTQISSPAQMVDYLEALAWRRSCRAAADRALSSVDALITPTVAALRKPIGHETIEVAGREVSYMSPLSHFTALVNHIGLPALALPLNAPNAPPPSLQLIGPAWSEEGLLSIGRALEEAALVVTQTPPHFASSPAALR